MSEPTGTGETTSTEPSAVDDPGPVAPGVERARKVARDLDGSAPWIFVAFLVVAVLSALDLLVSPASASGGSKGIGAVLRLVSCGLLGAIVSQLLRATAAGLELLASRSESAGSSGQRLLRLPERVGEELDRPVPSRAAAAAVPSDPLVAIREAIQGGRWDEARTLLGRVLEERPDDPEGPRLAVELDQARASAAHSLLAKVDAAREVNDPQRVIELRDTLAGLLEEEPLRTFDRETARWLMGVVQKRLRAAAMRAEMRVEVAELASRVAERFDHTAEGASLRAALPTLRRSAGLCARCGQPYTGIANACPACLATASIPATGTTPATPPDPSEDQDEDAYGPRSEDEFE